jgi:CRISPR-associated protein Cas1
LTYIPLRQTPIRERASILFIEHGRIDINDQAFAVFDAENGCTHIPVAGLACLMLEPGTRISHAAVVLAAKVGTLLVWTGEAGVRLYSVGQPGGASARHLLYQAKIAVDETARLKVVRAMYAMRFEEAAPDRRSIDQLRGLEGVRVREIYRKLADEYGVEWHGRRYEANNFRAADVPNQCISAATACLYGLTEAAILAAGYAPQIGFLHRGRAQSFVYDIADLFKFETVVPEAFCVAARVAKGDDVGPIERATRIACRDAFRKTRLLDRIIPAIHDVLAASGIDVPEDAPEGMEPVLQKDEAA